MERWVDPTCIFCRIVGGTAPASIVYRDDEVTALVDIRPINPGHLLVVPNTHAVLLSDAAETSLQAMFSVGGRLAAALRRAGLRCEGVNLFLADGPPAQEVPHVHLHVIPRFTCDGFGFAFPKGYGVKPREELEQAAVRIRAAPGRA